MAFKKDSNTFFSFYLPEYHFYAYRKSMVSDKTLQSYKPYGK